MEQQQQQKKTGGTELVVLVRGSRPGKQVQLSENEIRFLCQKARDIFMSQPILLDLEAPIKICGEYIYIYMYMYIYILLLLFILQKGATLYMELSLMIAQQCGFLVDR